ncbi:N-acetylgalactosamine-N,N'-diacetylbacillosaminyl-diphospho-undecaprenol 4-alpha-N-acetylgalactosaminyltransferase [Winogradskyella epiphytica]|uniref:N-acetylgalactosamine-N, N'-diacetylbacillosaminyl-diphospho-undecaprenol 4-alpha-N-acetylgalactosaminyltransferase n=1 Tax=Winogradskyella epiphytica TaxID=262005 RepID=A0A2V4X7T6_9FLAO|nr:glycosyltransferase [Winogradskyella epiphytica]PYE81709.1 N-acetylgalactosamine-N,N'-diacetylbacillosaminyl-diphospho-undecaprenol 4-alpha-N-acetylgalactosaminyltransferase [Winogradskyella epiphytica]GGW63230.1 N-acetylgalactosamine-N,N'-diacetylbacillosaminyl-diphospho-undecaprenol 4-alpha-N-acetylgalactosaminyltransferase [Winogradskyella epiphytica]
MLTESKTKISILCTSLGSGGAQKVISLLLHRLIHDYNVTLVLFYNTIHFPIPDEVNVIALNEEGKNNTHFMKLVDLFKFIRTYNRIIKQEDISISISFLAFPNLVNGVISTRNKELKTIISERGFPSDNTTSKLSYYISKLSYPVFYNKCDKLFSNSIHINKDLKDNFGITIPMEVIYNPIEIPKKLIDPKELITTDKHLNIITAGTLNTRKNQIMIIRALNENNTNDKLTILGEGHLLGYLTNEIAKRKLTNQVFLEGNVKNVNSYLLQSNCFVLSSFTEGFPNALMEAMAIGLPCISTNCLSGPLELLNDNEDIELTDGDFYIGKYGLLVNNDDHIGLSKALEFFRNNPTERERFSALSLQKASEYQLDSIYSRFKTFIQL